jgi:hypothetical protein
VCCQGSYRDEQGALERAMCCWEVHELEEFENHCTISKKNYLKEDAFFNLNYEFLMLSGMRVNS